MGPTVYFPYGSTEDFEEIECNILGMNNITVNDHFTRPTPGEAAGSEGFASAAGPPAVSAWQSEGLEALRLGWPS